MRNTKMISGIMPIVASKEIYGQFLRNRNVTFAFIKPGGNFGDDLIYKGAEKLAQLAGVTFKSMDYGRFIKSTIPEDVIIYIHGGGGFNPIWHGTSMKILNKSIDCHPKKIIVGPSTFYDDKHFLENHIAPLFLNKKPVQTLIFAREATSYQILKGLVPEWVTLSLDQDTAFNLNESDFRNRNSPGRYILYAIREDREKKSFERKNSFDLWLDPIFYSKTFDQWISLHGNAKRIITDRLHSAILGTLLGKEVVLLPNNYHKNRSVFEYSLRERNVAWQEDL